jgi:hypothetical protein
MCLGISDDRGGIGVYQKGKKQNILSINKFFYALICGEMLHFEKFFVEMGDWLHLIQAHYRLFRS